jgi:hypothetical protein
MKRSQRFFSVVALMLVFSALLACKKKKEAAEGTGTGTAAVAAADSVGVPECDEYLTKYDKCLSEKVPEAARPQLKQSIGMMRNAWKQAASNPAAKAGLAQGCKQALETAKSAMSMYNCTW